MRAQLFFGEGLEFHAPLRKKFQAERLDDLERSRRLAVGREPVFQAMGGDALCGGTAEIHRSRQGGVAHARLGVVGEGIGQGLVNQARVAGGVEFVDDDVQGRGAGAQGREGLEVAIELEHAAMKFPGGEHVRRDGGNGHVGAQEGHFQQDRAGALGVDQHQVEVRGEGGHQVFQAQAPVCGVQEQGAELVEGVVGVNQGEVGDTGLGEDLFVPRLVVGNQLEDAARGFVGQGIKRRQRGLVVQVDEQGAKT